MYGRLYNAASTFHNVKEEEPVCDTAASTNGFLCCRLAFFFHAFHAGGGAVVVVIQLVHWSETSAETQCEYVGIVDVVLSAERFFCVGASDGMLCDRLFSDVLVWWGARHANDLIIIVDGSPR